MKYVDINNENNEWMATFRYEETLDKCFLVLPKQKEIHLLNWEEIPKEISNHFSRSKLHKSQNYYNSPVKAQIQLTNACNYNCKMCYASSNLYKKQELSLIDINALAIKLKKFGVLRVNLVGGEIFMRRDIFEIIEIFKKHHLLVSCITNGLIPGTTFSKYKELLKEFYAIQVSCNGIKDNYCDEYGFKDWNRAFEAIKNVYQSCKNATISFVVTEENMNDILKFFELCFDNNIMHIKFGGVIWTGKSHKESANSYYSKVVPYAKTLIKQGCEKYPTIDVDSQFDSPIAYNKDTFYDNYRKPDMYISPEGKDSMYIKSNGDIYPFPLLSNNIEFKMGTIHDDFNTIWITNSKVNELRNITYADTICSKICHNQICGFWNRSYAYAWSNDLKGKVPCDYDS